jgi:hypothetical protein
MDELTQNALVSPEGVSGIEAAKAGAAQGAAAVFVKGKGILERGSGNWQQEELRAQRLGAAMQRDKPDSERPRGELRRRRGRNRGRSGKKGRGRWYGLLKCLDSRIGLVCYSRRSTPAKSSF